MELCSEETSNRTNYSTMLKALSGLLLLLVHFHPQQPKLR